MAIDHNAQKSIFLDTLYCDEVAFQDDDDENLLENQDFVTNQVLIDQDLVWDDEELESLFVKEKETFFISPKSQGRKEAVEWILKVNSHYGFSALTAILAVNYLDRFLATLSFQEDKQPWVLQLAAVTCLSLAAKVEETCVPLLLDLQVCAFLPFSWFSFSGFLLLKVFLDFSLVPSTYVRLIQSSRKLSPFLCGLFFTSIMLETDT